MGQAIGQILPLAVGVAISPVPIIAVILMILAVLMLVIGVKLIGDAIAAF